MESKTKLRMELLEKRQAITESDRRELSEKIMFQLFSRPQFQKAKIVAFYLPKGKEVDSTLMISKALQLGKEVLIPVTQDKVTFYKFENFEDLIKGKYGIDEPAKKIMPSNYPDIVIVPGVVFGLCMHRIGYGKGYYDKYLSTSSAYRIGLCYDFQLRDRLPSHSDDQRMDEIITEKRVIV